MHDRLIDRRPACFPVSLYYRLSVFLGAGAAKVVSVTIDPHLLADWREGGWEMPAGRYAFALGDDAEHLGAPIVVQMPGKHWKD